MKEGTILIVDDEELIRNLLVDMLEKAGDYNLLTASNGEEALETFHQKEIDLVFTDLRMPVMGGMELLAGLKKHNPEIPVCILTGYGQREDVIEALRLGAANFLMKPQEIEMVYPITTQLLRIRKKKRLEKRIYDFFIQETQTHQIPSDLQYTLPLIDLVTEKIERVGLCNQTELMNVRLALDEALVNAVVHGNLEISSRSKGNTLDELVQFNQLVKERSAIEPYRSKQVRVSTSLTPNQAVFSIEDDGAGFNWRNLPVEFEDVEALSNHGRGLILIRAFMSDIEFNEKGNRITLIKSRSSSIPSDSAA